MKRTTWWLLGGLCLALLAGAGGLWSWRRSVEHAALARTLDAADRAVAQGHWGEARAVMEEQSRRRGRPAEAREARHWLELEFRTAGGLRDFATLEALAARDPTLAGLDEDAALWLWRLRRIAGDEAGADAVRALWRGHESLPVAWTCAEVDALWTVGRRAEAQILLAQPVPTGPAGVPLLLRRALLGADATARFDALTTAYRLDPANADLRGVRASLLEQAGQSAYARVDYVAALLADRTNPLRRDELASFYLRQGDVATAVQTWREGLDDKSPDFMWVRAVFWGRMIGLRPPEATGKLGVGRRSRFAGWLAGLPTGQFWDEEGYRALHLPTVHAQREPVVFWLRLLELLRGDDWEGANALMVDVPSVAAQTAPRLCRALRATAIVRSGKAPGETGLAWPAPAAASHRWWGVIGAALAGDGAAGREFLAVARGPQAATAALLAAGWTGPALKLTAWPSAAREETAPWLRFGLLQAIRLVRGPAEALTWGQTLPAYHETDYVVASLELAAGQPTGEPTLRRLATRDDDTGFAAGWLLATWLLEQGRVDEVDALLLASPGLAVAPEGAGLRARVALSQGRKDEARALYAPLAETLIDAGAYLAREAFAAGDLAQARHLTEFWLERYADDLQLRANLRAIEQAEQLAKGEP